MNKPFVLPDSIAKYHDLWLKETESFLRCELDVRHSDREVWESILTIRGTTLNFDGRVIQIAYYWDSAPTEKQIGAMKKVESEFISGQKYLSELLWEVVPKEESLSVRTKNWGWVHLNYKEFDSMTPHMMEYGTLRTPGKYNDLWNHKKYHLSSLLVGEITKTMRGVTLNFDAKTIQITVYFDSAPTEKYIESLEEMETEFVSGHEYMTDLVLEVVPVTESLVNKVKNWGWVYLRRED